MKHIIRNSNVDMVHEQDTSSDIEAQPPFNDFK